MKGVLRGAIIVKLPQYTFFLFFTAIVFMAFIFYVAETADTLNTPQNEMLLHSWLALICHSLEPRPLLPERNPNFASWWRWRQIVINKIKIT